MENGPAIHLPDQFSFQGQTLKTKPFLEEMETTGLIVLTDDRVVFEQYWLGNDATTQTASWSLVKSFVSALVGIAVGEGVIASIEDPVTRYVPTLTGSGYDGVRLKDVLQMSSGIRWNEDYSDPESDIRRSGRALGQGGSLDSFAASCVRECEPGTFNRYNTTDTHVLGMVLRGATSKVLSEYLQEKLWEPMGMEADAFWIVDSTGAEFAGAGLSAVLRDYARLGLLYLNDGARNGAQIVPADWVRASVTADAPHLRPGERPNAAVPWGYGFQWWLPDDSGAFSAIGIYNQYIFVDPATRLVVAKTSAFRDFAATRAPAAYRIGDHFAFFRAIAAQCR